MAPSNGSVTGPRAAGFLGLLISEPQVLRLDDLADSGTSAWRAPHGHGGGVAVGDGEVADAEFDGFAGPQPTQPCVNTNALYRGVDLGACVGDGDDVGGAHDQVGVDLIVVAQHGGVDASNGSQSSSRRLRAGVNAPRTTARVRVRLAGANVRGPVKRGGADVLEERL